MVHQTSLDGQLWQAFKGGSREAFAQIYDEYIGDLLSYGYRVTSDRQLIRDSIQDLFLHLWEKRSNLAGTDSIRFYLYRSLRNRILRNSEKNSHQTIDPTELFDSILDSLSIEEELIATEHYNEQILRLKKALQQLPNRQQEVIQLRYYHDFSLDEIAQIMQITNQSVRNLLQRTIGELRKFFLIVIGLGVWTLVEFNKK